MSKNRIINRELSWLRFNERVLSEATDKRNPLLERLRFLAIFASNLDEFFMVRVSGLREQIDAGYIEPDPSGYVPTELLSAITKVTNELTDF
ncbi:MAG: polyphosphate kinase 1, partial [Deferribacteraceae bacterium]|nr:polyphosphate kinase 1 [Deferribacteraceae bacterium]